MLTEIDTSSCILFLGSGFSADCKNILNLEPPIGDGLRRDLITLLKDTSYNDHDLQVVSEAAASASGIDLYQELYNRFTISDVPETHRALVRLPWRRIYTTNYDDTVEFASPDISSFNYPEPKPRRIPQGALIHLHGVIRSTNPDNVMHQLVLSERSYVRQHLEKSSWFDEFDKDVRFSDATFFLGYSLKDQHITALLMKNPTTVEKVFFVTRGQPDRPTAMKFQQYGRILPIGIPGFASLIQTLPKPAQPTAPNQLKSLRYLDPLQDKAAITVPTSPEVRHLLTFGSFNFKRMIAGLLDETYVVERRELIEKATKLISSSRTLIVDGRLGNGKTIFLNLLAVALSTRGYKCFLCRSNATTATRDLAALRAMGKVAIFFDSYGLALDIIQEFSVLPNAVFAVAVRTSVHAVQMHEILDRFPAPVTTISINTLKGQEREAFSRLANLAGLLSETFDRKVATARDFRELVLTIFDNAQVRSSIETELLPSLRGAQVGKVLLVSYLLKRSGHDADPTFLRDVTGIDPYQALFAVKAAAEEVFDLGEQLQIRSSIFSSYLVDTFFDPKDVLATLESLIVAATSRRDERGFRRMAGALIQVSFLSRVLARLPNYQADMHSLFERLRQNREINEEPLFWLQYAMLMVDTDKSISENFIATAYDRAKARVGFLTYQIDTFALRLALIAEAASRADQVTRFDDIVTKLALVIRMLGDTSHRYYAISVLNEFEPFVRTRGQFLTVAQKNRLVYDLSRTATALESLSKDFRVQTGSDRTKDSVLKAKDQLLV